MGTNQPREVYNIIEGKDGKARWVRIGSAFVNKDGSINAILDVYPRDGKLQIRERRNGRHDEKDGE
ncbi:MAG: hypothetical protein WC956_11220 [bacterium]